MFYQIPFFACNNIILHPQYQKDIVKYIYCNDNSIQPYPGDYGKTPQIWKEKHFLIKHSLSILQLEKRQELKKKGK